MTPANLEAKLEHAPVGYGVLVGPDMVFASANRRYLEMVGRTADIVGRPWVSVFPELVGSPTHDAVKRAAAGERVEVFELPIALVRGGVPCETFFNFSLEPTRTETGDVEGFVVLAVEVTEIVVRRREAEALAAELRISEQRYRTIFAAMDEGYCLMQMHFDADDRCVDYTFLEANDAFMRHTGLVGALGKTARTLVPDLDESWFRLYGDVALTGEPKRFENNAPAMGRWFEVFATRVGPPELRQVGLVFKDVSLKRREEESRQTAVVAEQAARQKAEEANRAKDDFLATVSHELRTPLNAMLGWVSLLRTDRLPDAKRAQALATIERNARAQAQIIDDLLDVSRILEGKLRLELEPLDAAEAVGASVDAARPAADAKGVRLQVSLTTGCTVLGDPHRLQQIVSNLLTNAVKFTPRGGRVQVALSAFDSSVEIVVSDTGQGISADLMPHVFERFRQGEGGTRRQHGGLGLGLSIVRHLVELHAGRVEVESEGAERGATFRVRLPLALARRATVHVPSGLREGLASRGLACPPELDGLDVVAVDDEPDSREMVRSLLEACGAKVRVASSASEALAVCAERRPDVLVSDIGMPGEDGYALVERLRAMEAGGPRLPAVALTAYARSEDRTKCLLAGFTSHVPKPVEPLELLAVVASLARRTP